VSNILSLQCSFSQKHLHMARLSRHRLKDNIDKFCNYCSFVLIHLPPKPVGSTFRLPTSKDRHAKRNPATSVKSANWVSNANSSSLYRLDRLVPFCRCSPARVAVRHHPQLLLSRGGLQDRSRAVCADRTVGCHVIHQHPLCGLHKSVDHALSGCPRRVRCLLGDACQLLGGLA
jgi:hypothetical protein